MRSPASFEKGCSGMFKSVRMAREANRLRAEFELLWTSTDAYRPVEIGGYQQPAAMRFLTMLADLSKPLGATAGDVNVLAVEMLKSIDELESYDDAYEEVMRSVESGDILTVAGGRMCDHVSPEAVDGVLVMVGSRGRAEAWAVSDAAKRSE